MNGDLELKLQAYLDGEVGRREAARVEAWLEDNDEAKALLTELRMTKQALAVGGELPRTLPQSGDFYWSKIQREIARVEQDSESAEEPAWMAVMRRFFAPAAGVALLLLLTFVSFKTFTSGADPAEIAVVEIPSEHIGAYSFRSESENMFVVWVYDRPSRTGESEPNTSGRTDL